MAVVDTFDQREGEREALRIIRLDDDDDARLYVTRKKERERATPSNELHLKNSQNMGTGL